MKNYLKEIEKISKEDAWNYEYDYFTIDGENLIKNSQVAEYFGKSREGFEKYREENPDSRISYSGEISLRAVFDRENDKVIGYITEKKIKNPKYLEKAKRLYEKQKEEVIKCLNIADIKNFNYYLDIYLVDFDFNTNINTYARKISKLLDLVENYENDDDFKDFFDKIVK